MRSDFSEFLLFVYFWRQIAASLLGRIFVLTQISRSILFQSAAQDDLKSQLVSKVGDEDRAGGGDPTGEEDEHEERLDVHGDEVALRGPGDEQNP